jgi:hypothetical protein
MRSSISQYGITWKFDKPVIAGQFKTGDWWVRGPVKIVSVTPAPGKAGPHEKFNPKVDNFGETGLKDDKRMRHGSQINPVHNGKQGYDSRVPGYAPELTVTFPCTLLPGRSLVSTVSHDSIPNKAFVKNHFHDSNAVLKSAAVLTCLAVQPAANSFRPPYAGKDKPIHCACKLKKNKLLSLEPVEKVPSYKQYARYFKRPWLDSQRDWIGLALNPTENLPDYGREYARLVGMASLMLLLKVTRSRPKTRLIKTAFGPGWCRWGSITTAC